MLRVTSKITQQIQHRFVSSSTTQLINRNTTPYKEDHKTTLNKTENSKAKKPHKQLTTEERINQDLERASRIEAARYLYARPGQKNK